jgi:hypothetical protein
MEPCLLLHPRLLHACIQVQLTPQMAYMGAGPAELDLILTKALVQLLRREGLHKELLAEPAGKTPEAVFVCSKCCHGYFASAKADK